MRSTEEAAFKDRKGSFRQRDPGYSGHAAGLAGGLGAMDTLCWTLGQGEGE